MQIGGDMTYVHTYLWLHDAMQIDGDTTYHPHTHKIAKFYRLNRLTVVGRDGTEPN